MTHWLSISVVVVYIFGLFAVSWWARGLSAKRPRGIVGYLLAGRGLPPWIGAALFAGLAVGGASTVGVAERAYVDGISAGWYNAAWAAGAFLMGLVAAKRYRRYEITTLPELLERHYSTTARVLGVVGQLAIQLVITSLQYVAGGVILSSLMPDVFSLQTGMLASAIVFVAITLIGGFWAAGLTNVVNVIVIYFGVVLCAVMAVKRVGASTFAAQIPPANPGFDLSGVGLGLITAWFIVMMTQALSTQSVIQISFASRDERSASWAYILGGFIILPVGFIAAVIGMAAAVLHPGINPTEALPRVVLDLPPLASGLILAGLWAADVSTASALLMGSASLVSSDIIKRFFAPSLAGRREETVCRITVLLLGMATFLLALTARSILKMLLIGLTLSTGYTLIVLMTMFWPRMCRRSSASWTLAATMVALAGWLLAPASWHVVPHPIYFTWAVALVTFFLVAAIDRRPIRPS